MTSGTDEMVDGRGRIRPHWQGLIGALADLPGDGLSERARRLDAGFAADGIGSLLPGAEAAWRCDPVPLPISGAEFATLSSGLAQRATLLEAVLDDLYGPQELLAEGLIPPSLIFANPGFLRPCRASLPDMRARAPLMGAYAADLMRGDDGRWMVVCDRTSRPAGFGLVLENRRQVARAMPESLRASPPRPLRAFFDAWQDSLTTLGQHAGGNPAIAILTPGTRHPFWFEHLLLARELGCALVEGGDLTVRNGALFIKTLAGLQPVDVLIRRLDGRRMDPVEFGATGSRGVPGLLDAARHGAVRIVNDPGTGVMEAPAWATVMAALAPRLLGTELLLPQAETLALSDPRTAARILADLQEAPERWLLRPALDGNAAATDPAALDLAERARFSRQVAEDPAKWVATRTPGGSVAPVVAAGRLQPRPVQLRMFLVHDGVGWRCLPGGMARVLREGETLGGRLPGTGLAKDVWVLTEDRADIRGPAITSGPPIAVRRTAGDLPSRTADNLFWLGRYVERLESSARLLRLAASRGARGDPSPRELADLAAVARCLIGAKLLSPEDAPSGAGPGPMLTAISRAAREGGPLAHRAAEVARLTEAVRDRLTGEMYATFSQPLRHAMADLRAARGLDALEEGLGTLLRLCAAVAGTAAENMVRGGGFLFLDLGRRMERASATSMVLAEALKEPPSRQETALRLALDLCDSVITYRSRYLTTLQAAPVLDLVLADPGNPRGIAFQCAEIRARLSSISDGTEVELVRAARALQTEVEAMAAGIVDAPDQAVAAAALPPRLEALRAAIGALSDSVTRRYFALLPAVQTIGSPLAPVDRPLMGAA
ncbi:putative circularly permuted ATP-grasp superfamily protein [Humitalea rosea]|uniref:Putative circularly permuted ATP-grasp superfamily protein n=1 Tax=Humitalea rosea TaxID=990373 RepID=A0A2W7ID77_9PROT|nr:circularly permuted type 2 ATP-grasp protein [Humitalea rosea]PZW44741.1 putative circularly permuted ATP-grasp superfamily protein [Humitalea rosea]